MKFAYLILLAFSPCLASCSPTARDMFEDKDVRALAVAGAKGETNKIDKLIAKGVDINSVGKDDCTPLAWTYVKGTKKGFQHLLERGANPNERYGKDTLLFMTLYADDPFYLESALKYGGDSNQRKYRWTETSPNGSVDTDTSLLGSAIFHVSPIPDKIKILIKYGADVHEKDADFISSCAMMNHYELVYIFLEAEAPYSTNREKLSLLERIENRAVHPDSPEYEWLEKVVQWLKDRNIEVTPKEWKKQDQPKIINVITENPNRPNQRFHPIACSARSG